MADRITSKEKFEKLINEAYEVRKTGKFFEYELNYRHGNMFIYEFELYFTKFLGSKAPHFNVGIQSCFC